MATAAKRRNRNFDLFEPEHDPLLDELELIRRGFPELTRCVVCRELGDTDRVMYNNAKGERLLTIWVHEHCREWLVQPQPLPAPELWKLDYEWDHELNYKPTYAYPKFAPVQKFSRQFYAQRPERGGPVSRRPEPTHLRCYCCERYESPEHRLHRRLIGYHPSKPWERGDG